MLQLKLPKKELWDEEHEEFIYTKPVTLKLEHSLISISKWEAKWCLPFFSTDKTIEQTIDYIKCMTLNQDVDPITYNALSVEDVRKIKEYIDAPMTASKIAESTPNKKNSNEYISSELIYYWMIAFNIPVEFEKWHINRLIMLIRICSEKEKAQNKKTTRADRANNLRDFRAKNAQRRAELAKKGLKP